LKPLRILIVDDHEVFRRGLKSLLETRSGFQVCGEAANGSEACAATKRLKPDILLLDVSMPDKDGIQVAEEVQESCPSTAVILITASESAATLAEAFAAGAKSVVYKSDAGKDLIKAIEAVSEGKKFISPEVTEILMKSNLFGARPATHPELDMLTEREREVLGLLAEGKNPKEIGLALRISPRTVNIHRANIMDKMRFHSLSELIFFAVRHHVVNI